MMYGRDTLYFLLDFVECCLTRTWQSDVEEYRLKIVYDQIHCCLFSFQLHHITDLIVDLTAVFKNLLEPAYAFKGHI